MSTTKLELPEHIDLARFVSEHAHDLRSPFNHVIGFTKMTLNTLTDAPVSDIQKEDLTTVYRSGLRSFLLMNGLIDIARLKRNEKKLGVTAVEIRPLLDQGLAQWKKYHPGEDIQTEWRVTAVSSTLRVDGQIFQQVIAGWIAYVALFAEAKPLITVSVDEEADCFVLTFASAGMKAPHHSELDQEMLGYTGRAFVELHGGAIRLAEENDTGALIQFSLPKA